MIEVTLQIHPAFFVFAKERAEEFGYFGPADYLNAVLNMGMLTQIDYENRARNRDARQTGLDPDDEIPF